jgi:cell division septation protein DedD
VRPAPVAPATPVAPEIVVATGSDGRPVGAHPGCPADAPFASFSGTDSARMMTCHALPGAVGRTGITPRAPQGAPHAPTGNASGGAGEGRAPVGAHPDCPVARPYAAVEHRADGTRVLHCHAYPHSVSAPSPYARTGAGAAPSGRVPAQPIPPGYTAVWADDRLNPYRGVGTAEGEAQMRTVWTDDAPMRLVDEPRPGFFGSRPPAATLTAAESAAIRQPYAVAPRAPAAPVVTPAAVTRGPAPAVMTRPAASQAVAGRFVQVGSFADPANATRTRAALEARGLPVATREVRRSNGQVLRVVMAGPFGATSEAQQALATARSLGFRDAYLRN